MGADAGAGIRWEGPKEGMEGVRRFWIHGRGKQGPREEGGRCPQAVCSCACSSSLMRACAGARQQGRVCHYDSRNTAVAW